MAEKDGIPEEPSRNDGFFARGIEPVMGDSVLGTTAQNNSTDSAIADAVQRATQVSYICIVMCHLLFLSRG